MSPIMDIDSLEETCPSGAVMVLKGNTHFV